MTLQSLRTLVEWYIHNDKSEKSITMLVEQIHSSMMKDTENKPQYIALIDKIMDAIALGN